MCKHCKPSSIPDHILNKLPKGEFLGFTKAKEYIQLSQTETIIRHVVAIKWRWRDNFLYRTSIFSLETGDYIEED